MNANTFHPLTLVLIGAVVAILCVAFPGLLVLLLGGIALSVIGAAVDRAYQAYRDYRWERTRKSNG